jgi:hypothetical protein
MKCLSQTLAVLSIAVISSPAWAGGEGMHGMPKITPKKTYSVTTDEEGEALLEQRGYGDEEPMVRMMNLMMVGGSGYEGMDMSEMKVASDGSAPRGAHGTHSGHGAPPAPEARAGQGASYDFTVKITPEPPKVGTNLVEVNIQTKDGAKPARGLRIKAQVYMTNMDMGTEEPKVKEAAPGRYQVQAVFSMNGPWALKLLLPGGGEKVFPFNVAGK